MVWTNARTLPAQHPAPAMPLLLLFLLALPPPLQLLRRHFASLAAGPHLLADIEDTLTKFVYPSRYVRPVDGLHTYKHRVS
uniref:Putative secreted protein n=1 Tax=Panstrongylus lignarius TaxID=156445 RepID=A0A224Y4X0_9HEMI